jgi:maleylacetate reductase
MAKKPRSPTRKIQPEVILYDAELVRTLPVGMTVTSALNAMAHAAEALYAVNRNPMSTMLAIEGLRAFAAALPRVIDNPEDLGGRGETLYGAWLCGTVLGQVGMALHHKLCHTLGGSFDLPHAETHAVVLPHAIAYNARAVPELQARSARSSAAPCRSGAVRFRQNERTDGSSGDLGFKESDVDKAAELATRKPYWNPRPVTGRQSRDLLLAAWAGEPPVLCIDKLVSSIIWEDDMITRRTLLKTPQPPV